MSEIRVRRSGLVSFAIRLGSTLTGLAFVVLVTSNLAQSDFGLWQLISRTIAYVIFVVNVLNFWTIRYRARGIKLGKTVVAASLIFSAILTVVYVAVSVGIAGSVVTRGGYEYDLFFFLISSPQVPLYLVIAVLEAILWGSVPEKASLGFGVFEIAKVIIGGVAVGIFHLSLTGAILGVMEAQVVQLIVTLVLTRKEFSDHVSISIIGTMVRNGWLAILNSIQPLVVNFDFLIVALVTASTLPIATYAAAFVFANTITYSGWLATGLYASILAGRDPKDSTSQVLELQYLFILPMTVGMIILAFPLLHLLNPIYTEGVPILIVLAVGSAFMSISTTFDSVISGTDTTDALRSADLSLFLRSKLFLLSKINLILAFGYLVTVGIVSKLFSQESSVFFGLPAYDFLGVCWATAAFAMAFLGVVLKLSYVRAVAKLSIPRRTLLALIVGTAGFAATLYLVTQRIHPQGGELMQAGYILLIGVIALAVYAAIVLILSSSMRRLVRIAISTLV